MIYVLRSCVDNFVLNVNLIYMFLRDWNYYTVLFEVHVETECGNNELTSTNILSSRISPGDNSTYWISNWFSIYFRTDNAQLAKCDHLPCSLKSNNLHRCLHGIVTYVRKFITREMTIKTTRKTIKLSQNCVKMTK